MSDDYKLFEIHYSVSGSGGIHDGVNYEVARSSEEARELFTPWLERLNRNFRNFGFTGVETRIIDAREMDISHTGWKIRLEEIVDPR